MVINHNVTVRVLNVIIVIKKKRIEEEWERTRKLFDREQLNETLLQDKLTEMDMYNSHLMITNDLILNSNSKHQI